MNHFELFNLPVELDIDLASLKTSFLSLQQQYHPDKAEDKDQALIKSSEINQAFKVLSQVDSRAAYLLAILSSYNQLWNFVSNLMKQPPQNI
jgi:molecular chaperone HscB